MSITTAELKFYKSAAVNDTTSNGGVMSANAIADGVKNNVFPDVSQAERTAGITRYRKIFFKVASAENLALQNPRVFVEKHTPGEDRVLIFPGTQTDTQNDIATPNLYGAGQLKTDVSVGATSCVVITENGADTTFRNGELGRIHNPEFTIAEWYRTGDTYLDQMDVTEQLVRCILGETVGPPFARTSYQRAFERYAGFDPLRTPVAGLPRVAAQHGLTPPPGLEASDRDGWLNFLLVELVEPNLGLGPPELLYDYPASQAALAHVRQDDPPVAERFELYVQGIEVCNGYQELTDPDELRRRIREHRMDERLNSRLLEAMDAGLPPCSGVALGFDRLVMLAAGASALSEVIAFPFDRA